MSFRSSSLFSYLGTSLYLHVCICQQEMRVTIEKSSKFQQQAHFSSEGFELRNFSLETCFNGFLGLILQTKDSLNPLLCYLNTFIFFALSLATTIYIDLLSVGISKTWHYCQISSYFWLSDFLLQVLVQGTFLFSETRIRRKNDVHKDLFFRFQEEVNETQNKYRNQKQKDRHQTRITHKNDMIIHTDSTLSHQLPHFYCRSILV